MEKKTTSITHRIVSTVGLALFFSVFLLNVSLFVKSNNSKETVSVNNLFSAAAADDESGDSGASLKWSYDIDCHGWGTGDYKVCNVNGSGATCSSSGAVNCTCGTNCD